MIWLQIWIVVYTSVDHHPTGYAASISVGYFYGYAYVLLQYIVCFERLVILNQMLFLLCTSCKHTKSTKSKDRSVMPMIVKTIRLSVCNLKGVPIDKYRFQHDQRR